MAKVPDVPASGRFRDQVIEALRAGNHPDHAKIVAERFCYSVKSVLLLDREIKSPKAANPKKAKKK